MAQKVQTLYIDDIDGGEAAGTVRFGLDGVGYEIDLSAEHTKELHTALGKYIDHARKAGGTSRRAPAAAPPAPPIPPQSAPGPGNRAWTSRTAAAYPPTSSPNTRRPPGINTRRPGLSEHFTGSGCHQGARLTTPTAGGAYRTTVELRDADRHRLPSERYLVPGHARKQPLLYGARHSRQPLSTRAEPAGLTRGSLPDAARTTAQ